VSEGLADLERGVIDAFVYDAPILRYLARNEYPGTLSVLTDRFLRQDYAIALPSGSALRESINQVLLKEISQPAWKDTLFHYLGG
jgi:ABC-type amino acid transport substrate-binding protein